MLSTEMGWLHKRLMDQAVNQRIVIHASRDAPV